MSEVTSGQQILHYRLTDKLGEGGMGVVWKATDTTLDREVAIKVLPPVFASEPERLARFEREAKVLASLNHPNIATVYSVHTVDGDRYITMELVPGEDLAQRIERGPVPVTDAIEISRQIALALEAAHEHGVVHRDLKPANVRVTPDGRVKVLDFGLAKAMEASAPVSTMSKSPTLMGSGMTGGMILGTAAYMSPEQARGQAVDRRADIWSFGVLLYEMLTARRAFEGETVSDTLAAVLRAEPDRSLLPKDIPRALGRLLDRCLDKNAKRRLRDIGEALIVLEDIQAGRVETQEAPAPFPLAKGLGRERLFWGAGVAAAALMGAAAIWLTRPEPPEPPLRKFTLALETADPRIPVVSPDGRRIAYVQEGNLWIRDFGQLTSRELAQGLDADFRPAWSPDSENLTFAGSGGVSRVALASGAVVPVCSVSEFVGGSGAHWTDDDRIVFTKGVDHIYSVAAGGGVAEVLVARSDSLDADLHQPTVLPGGAGVLFVRHLKQGGPIVLAIASGKEIRDLFRAPAGAIWQPVYDPQGFILFERRGEGAGVWALPFSVDRTEVTGDAFLVTPDAGAPSISNDGLLAFRLGAGLFESEVVVVDRSGIVIETLTEPQEGLFSMALSPDGKQLALEVRDATGGDIWLLDLERKAKTRFAFGDGIQSGPFWSPDGRTIGYNQSVTNGMFLKPVDGSEAPRYVGQGFAGRFSPDGRYLLYTVTNGVEGTADIWYRSLAGGPDSLALVETAGADGVPMPAPQGGYVLYASSESVGSEIFLKQFPSGTGRWQISANGGSKAVWSVSGDRIYYWSSEEFFEVEVELTPAVKLGTPRRLFHLEDLGMQTWGRINVLPTANPDRFLMFRIAGETDPNEEGVVVVENWTREFRKK